MEAVAATVGRRAPRAEPRTLCLLDGTWAALEARFGPARTVFARTNLGMALLVLVRYGLCGAKKFLMSLENHT